MNVESLLREGTRIRPQIIAKAAVQRVLTAYFQHNPEQRREVEVNAFQMPESILTC